MSKINIEVRYPSHQDDARHYDTATLRKHYLVEKIMAPDEINMCYSMFDRIIVGGAMPVAEKLTLTSPDILRSEYFTQRREVGVINVGGRGAVTVGSDRYELEFKEALYIGRGDRHIVFESLDAEHPAKFYFNSAPAHKEYPCKKVSKKDAIVMHMGSLEESPRPPHGSLLLLRTARGCGSLPLHGRASGDPSHLDAQRAGRHLPPVEHPLSLRHPQLHLHLGHVRREPGLQRHGLVRPQGPPLTIKD